MKKNLLPKREKGDPAPKLPTQKVWILENKTTGKAIKIAVETTNIELVYAVGFETRKGIMAALDIVTAKDLEYDERIRRVEIVL